MNNIIINRLKQKNNDSSNSTNISSIQPTHNNYSGHYIQNNQIIKQDQISDLNSKYNPDIDKNYGIALDKRNSSNYAYSNDMWKAIIGPISKDNITINDLKISVNKPDIKVIKEKYEIELEERLKEKILAEKLTREYYEEHGLDQKTNEISQPTINLEDIQNLASIDNTFVELKNSAQYIFNKSSNLDSELFISSISKLDDLLDSIKNL